MRLFGVLTALGLALGALAAGPEISEQKFPAPPVNLFYFDDSEIVMVLDPEHNTLHRSIDAGEKWERVEDIPDGHIDYVIPHQFDNKVAVALGRKKKHWITYDQGKNWKAFETKEHPTGDPSKEPISFHASDSKRMLFHGVEDCFFDSCVGKVRIYFITPD